MKIISQTLSRDELKQMAGNFFADLIKAGHLLKCLRRQSANIKIKLLRQPRLLRN